MLVIFYKLMSGNLVNLRTFLEIKDRRNVQLIIEKHEKSEK